MSTYAEIVIVAFVAQLAVLPGEKVQFMIAALSTRYDPKVVVAAAGSAFAGWTAIEIAVGQALQSTLSPVVLDAVTAVLFFAFAVLLYRSMPTRETETIDGIGTTDDAETNADAETSADAETGEETDGGFPSPSDVTVPAPLDRYVGSFGGFIPIFLLTAAGEFGDKTQLVTIGLAVQYGATSAIWVGEMLAIIPVSLANAYVFHTFAHRFDRRRAHLVSAVLFAFFGADTVLSIATGFSVWETFVDAVSGAVSVLV